MDYSQTVLDHFFNPRNVGVIEDADGIGEVGNPVCGDMMTFYIKVKDNRLEDVKYKTFGCGAAIAVASMVSELAKGKTIEEALKITNEMIANELGGLPKNKLHCSNLGADALHLAIKNYLERKEEGESAPSETLKEAQAKTACRADEHVHIKCPYCDAVSEPDNPLCETCGRQFKFCPNCSFPLRAEERVCPNCLTRL